MATRDGNETILSLVATAFTSGSAVGLDQHVGSRTPTASPRLVTATNNRALAILSDHLDGLGGQFFLPDSTDTVAVDQEVS